jgi:hypothetical protein
MRLIVNAETSCILIDYGISLIQQNRTVTDFEVSQDGGPAGVTILSPPPPPPPPPPSLPGMNQSRLPPQQQQQQYSSYRSMEEFDDEISTSMSDGQSPSWRNRIAWLRKKGQGIRQSSSSQDDDIPLPSPSSHDSVPSRPSSLITNKSIPSNTYLATSSPSTATFPSYIPPQMTSHSWSRSIFASQIHPTEPFPPLHATATLPKYIMPDPKLLEEFHESDWTPYDSAYGAACPVCGCLPKNVRRAIEMTLIAVVSLALIYFVVTTSIRLSNDHGKGSKLSNDDEVRIKLDDDYYIEFSSNSNSNSKKTNDDQVSYNNDVESAEDDNESSSTNDDSINSYSSSYEGNRMLRRWSQVIEDIFSQQDLL